MNVQMRSTRGAIGKSWHAVALRELLETALGPGRSRDGKRSARAGAVQWIDVSPGTVRGAVEGIDGSPFEAQLSVHPIRPDDRAAVAEVCAAHPDLPARLASGEYPQLVERELSAHEVPILPPNPYALWHDCSCHDWPGPCVHVAALAFVLVEAVDEDPLLLLRWRGIELEDLAPSPTRPPGAAHPSGPARPSDAPHPSGAAHPSDATGAHPGSNASPRSDHHAGPPGPDEAAASDGPPDAASDSHDDSSDASDARPAGFDPTRMDLSLLTDTLGPDVVAALARFYGVDAQPKPTSEEASGD